MSPNAPSSPALLLNGATRVHIIVGDPIAQVKAPAGVTAALQGLGHNAVVVPAHVVPAELSAWLAGVSLMQNLDGVIVTVPHKFACFALCASTTERARFLGAVNVMRRDAQGRWHGDMCDGIGFVRAMREKGVDPAGRSALLVGAGGAGSAIAHALIDAGVSRLAIHDPDATRRASLVDRLAALGQAPVSHGNADPRGFDLVLNATPMGMKPTDPMPVQVEHLVPAQFAGCVITAPAVAPWVQAARDRGCHSMVGGDMFARVSDHLVEFLLGG